MHIPSKNSLSYLHIAAQGDQPYAFYIKNKFNIKATPGVKDLTDINVTDKNGCTPLHWAVYMGSPISISYLLANKEVNINAKDVWGQTPLHKAVKKYDMRVIKQLLVKGAKRDIKDVNGMTAMDIALEILGGYEILKPTLKIVTDMLSEQGHFAEFAMLKTPSKPITKNNKIVTVFFLLISITFTLSAIMVNVLNMKRVFYLEIALLAIDLIFFTITWLSKSSYIFSNKSIEFVDLLETFDTESLCPFCEIIRMPRSRHCNICNRCVERYDHHCPWVNNCIGKTNHFPFYMHLIILLGYVITIIAASVWALANADDQLADQAVHTERLSVTQVKIIAWVLIGIGIFFGTLVLALFIY